MKKLLSTLPTEDLVKELETRDGVTKITAEPYQKVITEEVGPAIILVIND